MARFTPIHVLRPSTVSVLPFIFLTLVSGCWPALATRSSAASHLQQLPPVIEAINATVERATDLRFQMEETAHPAPKQFSDRTSTSGESPGEDLTLSLDIQSTEGVAVDELRSESLVEAQRSERPSPEEGSLSLATRPAHSTRGRKSKRPPRKPSYFEKGLWQDLRLLTSFALGIGCVHIFEALFKGADPSSPLGLVSRSKFEMYPYAL